MIMLFLVNKEKLYKHSQVLLSMNIKKIEELAKRLESKEVDITFITPGPNLRYILGVNVETYERFCMFYLIPRNLEFGIIIPKLDELKVKDKGIKYFAYTDNEDPLEFLKPIKSMRARRIAFEERMPIKYYLYLKRIFGDFDLITLDEILYELRSIKDKEEIENIKEAVRAIEKSYKKFEEEVTENLSENEIVSIISNELLRNNAIPRYILVQAGEHSAIPHWTHSERKIKRGDVIVVDISATYNDYFGDLTRTYIFGAVDDKFIEIYNIVKEAHDKAILAIKEGELASNIDYVARSTISAKGYGDFFVHRTGHGLGLEVHEEPYISQMYRKQLKRGMVFTIEPGIYLPNKFGVRLESNVAIDENGKVIVLDNYWPDPVIR
jgi:Xaa-Pro aminopeptidase